jgi:hypothetical protein
MYSETAAFHGAKIKRNVSPILLFHLSNPHGVRVYSSMTPDESLAGVESVKRADGTFSAEGEIYAGFGTANIIAVEPRIIDWGEIRESLITYEESLEASWGMAERTQYTIKLDNSDAAISKIASTENLLNAIGELKIGFPGLANNDYMLRFKGRVISFSMDHNSVTLELQAV